MFNPLTPAELVLALGRVLKDAADGDEPRDDYRRGQLLSAYSVARHLAAEQSSAAELRGWFQDEMAGVLDATGLRRHARRVREAGDAAEVGEALCELLGELRDVDEPADGVRREVRIRLRQLADREVAALAHAGR